MIAKREFAAEELRTRRATCEKCGAPDGIIQSLISGRHGAFAGRAAVCGQRMLILERLRKEAPKGPFKTVGPIACKFYVGHVRHELLGGPYAQKEFADRVCVGLNEDPKRWASFATEIEAANP